MSEHLDRAIELCELWFESWGEAKGARWTEIMGRDAPLNPELVIEKVLELLREAKADVDSMRNTIQLLDGMIADARYALREMDE